jgi:hypothetical protein
MKAGQLVTHLRHSVATLTLMSACSFPALAQDAQQHMMTSTPEQLTPDFQSRTSKILYLVRKATERFKDVSQAIAYGYELQFGCVSGDSEGAMGLHYVNQSLVDGEIDLNKPEILIYEPLPDGRLRLTGADYLTPKEAWEAVDKPSHKAPPQLMGQAFHLFDAPNRFALPAFYTLHVWAWKDNPNGAFVNWHPNVSCESFFDKKPAS